MVFVDFCDIIYMERREDIWRLGHKSKFEVSKRSCVEIKGSALTEKNLHEWRILDAYNGVAKIGLW